MINKINQRHKSILISAMSKTNCISEVNEDYCVLYVSKSKSKSVPRERQHRNIGKVDQKKVNTLIVLQITLGPAGGAVPNNVNNPTTTIMSSITFLNQHSEVLENLLFYSTNIIYLFQVFGPCIKK